METFIYFLILLIMAAIPFLEYMVAIPVGILFMPIPTTSVIVASIIGNVITVILLIILVEKVRGWIKSKTEEPEPIKEELDTTVNATQPAQNDALHDPAVEVEQAKADKVEESSSPSRFEKQRVRARRYWDRFGLAGLSILGTGLLSSHLTALLACSFGANRAKLSLWMIISIVLWSVLLGGLIHFGVITFFE
ncbi:small multi-drug export protein [Geomicrobium sediminis]|uniref:Membrane protein n=1 Tax=Geomicrobium sediminis TaxID=1347788 RepID=A0ABS2PGB3_9BACL|nr:small multi-drug export protein [Geomicrobium sediminis]MBM7634479.1 putative membrane protein [Geomicrobium sediminis]